MPGETILRRYGSKSQTRRRRALRGYGSYDMSGQEFKSLRLTREQFDGLIENLEPHITERTRDISCSKKVCNKQGRLGHKTIGDPLTNSIK